MSAAASFGGSPNAGAADAYTITYRDPKGNYRQVPLAELPSLPIETFGLARQVVSKPRSGQRFVPIRGFYWFAQLRRTIAFESLLEMRNLMLLDHREQVSAVVAQPFLLSEVCDHFVDYWVRYRDGTQKLIDIKRAAKVDDPENLIVWEMTGDACGLLGWTHEVRSELPPILEANLRFLSNYRSRHVQIEPWDKTLLELCAEQPRSVKFLLDRAGPEDAVRPALFALLWQRRLTTDLEAEMINHSTLVRVAAAEPLVAADDVVGGAAEVVRDAQ